MKKEQEKIILGKLGLTKRGAMVILSNNELCERILNETPISITDFSAKYEVTKRKLIDFSNMGYISIFSNSGNQGSKSFIFENEALNFIKQISYKKSFNTKILSDITSIVVAKSKKVLSNNDYAVIENIFINGENLEETASMMGLSKERVRHIYEKALVKVKVSFEYSEKIQNLVQKKITLESELNVLSRMRQIAFEKNPKVDQSKINIFTERLVNLGLSHRATNCLRAAYIYTVGELVQFEKKDLMKLRNFGKNSLTEIEELMKKNGLTFGMEIKTN